MSQLPDAKDSLSEATSSGIASNTQDAWLNSPGASSPATTSPGTSALEINLSLHTFMTSRKSKQVPTTTCILTLTCKLSNIPFVQCATHQTSFKAKAETSSPIKITNYQKKKNKYTSDNEIHISKRTKLSDPFENESNFDVKPVNAVFDEKSFSAVADIAKAKVQQQVNLQGRVTFQGINETVITKGKTLLKQEAYLTDHTASIRLVLWEDDIKKITSGQSYQLLKVRVRLYSDAPYVTLNKQSTINQAELEITRSDDEEVKVEHELRTVLLPAEGVQSITRYLSCNSCRTRIEDKNKKVLKCAECGLSQLKKKCCSRIYAKAIFKTEKEPISLVLFDDKLKALYQLNRKGNPKRFEQLTDDDIEELILEAEALLVYNSKNNIVQIKQKHE